MTACAPFATQQPFTTARPNAGTAIAPLGQVTGTPACGNPQIANPAAVYCVLLGYKLSTEETPQGQAGVCVFKDGSNCDEWAFLRGTCGQEHSYCAQKGYGIKTVHDGQDAYSQEYAVCTDSSGKVIGTVTQLSGLEQQLKCGPNP